MIESFNERNKVLLLLALVLSLGVLLMVLLLYFGPDAKPSQYHRYMEQCLKDGQPEYMCASILRGFK